ncbi:MAG: hypothetical protein AAFZ15_24465 [Bacteroidota bacterium]
MNKGQNYTFFVQIPVFVVSISILKHLEKPTFVPIFMSQILSGNPDQKLRHKIAVRFSESVQKPPKNNGSNHRLILMIFTGENWLMILINIGNTPEILVLKINIPKRIPS